MKKYDCYYITYHATQPLYDDDPYKTYLYAKNNGDSCSTLIAGALSIALLEVWCASNGIKVDYYEKIVDDKYGRHFIKHKSYKDTVEIYKDN